MDVKKEDLLNDMKAYTGQKEIPIIDRSEMPADACIVGSPVAINAPHGSVEKKCVGCGCSVWISEKNAHFRIFACIDCAMKQAKEDGEEIASTPEDLDDTIEFFKEK